MKTIRASIRMVLFVTATLGVYWFWFFTHFFIPNKVHWRQMIFGAWTKSFVLISNMKIEVIGTAPKPPFFLVTNHLSYTDIGAIRAVTKGIFVAKSDIKEWFLAGRICRDMGTIFIDRTNRRDIPRAGELIIERLDAGEGVIVFPEGTSTKGEEVLPFNSSFLEFAARAEFPVSYASITYQTPKGEMPASLAACWWEDISFFAHLWRLLHVREYSATITFGDHPVTNTDRKMLASELRRVVEANFIPVL
ncbi:MAG: lysophospholipid acyltransferase family protein [Pyrinomonadaceae bacterium]